MPIEVEIDGVKTTVYTATEHKQILQDSVGDLSGLKATNASLKAEKQAALDQVAEIDAKAKAAELDAAKAAGDVEKVQLLLQEKTQESANALRDLQASLSKREIDALLSEITTTHGAGGVLNKHFDKILRADYEFETVDGGLQIKSKADGSILDRETFTKTVTSNEEYNSYLSAGKASGAGAHGGNNGAGATVNPFKKGENFNLTKQAELLKENPELANSLRSQA